MTQPSTAMPTRTIGIDLGDRESMYCVLNEAGEIIDFNPAAEECFGYRCEEVIGKPLDEVLIPPHNRAAHRAGLTHYLATGEGPYLGNRIEVDAMRKDGTLSKISKKWYGVDYAVTK